MLWGSEGIYRTESNSVLPECALTVEVGVRPPLPIGIRATTGHERRRETNAKAGGTQAEIQLWGSQ